MAAIAGGGQTAFDAGDIVRVRDEAALSVIVLPTDRAPDRVPDDLPEVDVCCMPIALVRTPTDAAEDREHMRWIPLRDLTPVPGGDGTAAV